MMEIRLENRGALTTQVDNEDYTKLAQFKWYWRAGHGLNPGYVFRRVGGRKERRVYINMHREILQAPPDMLVDHIDGNGLNNQRSNLRLATPSQNLQNQRPRFGTKSGYKGVYKVKAGWQAALQKDGKNYTFGTYETPREAANAYNAGALKHFGEFAHLNEGV